MSNYVLLYSGGDASMPESDEEYQAVMAEWGVWYEALGEAVVDGGAPFSPMAKTVGPDGTASDGVSGAAATGYTIVAADSLADAAKKAKGCPVLKGGGSVSVYETIDMS